MDKIIWPALIAIVLVFGFLHFFNGPDDGDD